MLEVWKKPNNFQGKSKLSTWLLSITHHKAVDLVRKKSRHDNNDSVDLDIIEGDQSTVLSTMTAEQDGDYIRATVNQLPPIYREVIYLSFYRELSYPEVAEVLSIPVGTVKTRMMNAKKQLKQLLAPAA
jgi:RNA polymerase sigma-70 factor (ECF subfamily)